MATWKQGQGALSEFKQVHHGAEIRIEAVPRQKTRGEVGDRAIGAQMGDAEWVQDNVAIRDAVRKKSGKYGVLDLPFVVAVNCLCAHADEEDAVTALFGSDAVQVWKDPMVALGIGTFGCPMACGGGARAR